MRAALKPREEKECTRFIACIWEIFLSAADMKAEGGFFLC
jgi:hypothetical protein